MHMFLTTTYELLYFLTYSFFPNRYQERLRLGLRLSGDTYKCFIFIVMKYMFVIALSLLFALNTYGQQNYPDSGFTNKAEAKNLIVNGKKEGKWLEYFDFTNKGECFETKDTNHAWFYRLTVYNAGIPNGIVREYLNGGEHLLRDEVTYNEGIKNGVERSYYVDGKPYFVIPYTNGKKNGLQIEYLYWGQSRTETPYSDDKKNGIEKQFYANGTLNWTRPYRNNKLNGIEKEYDSNAKLYWEIPYVDSVINGTEREYDTSGRVVEEISYVNSKINGDLKIYNSNGKLWSELEYTDNKILSSKFFTANSDRATQYGLISTIAGGGPFKMGADSLIDIRDGKSADSSVLFEPEDVKIDDSDNVYILDNGGNRVRKINPHTNVITTIAGNTKDGYNGDNILATMASLNRPSSITIDHTGNIYIADSKNHRIRKVTKATGIITTIAGTGEEGYKGDGGLAINAQLQFPSAIAMDTLGNIFIGDNNRVRKIDYQTGIINTIVGTGKEGYKGDSGLAVNAELHGITGLTFDKFENLYIVDCDNLCIRKVEAKNNIITTVAGGSYGLGPAGDYGPAIYAQLNWPNGIAIDSIGNIYVSDRNNAKIRKVDVVTGIISTVVGTGKIGDKGDGGLALYAELDFPMGLTIDRHGNLYIADAFNHKVRKVIFPR